MDKSMRHNPSEIRAYRAAHPKLRERDIAAQLGICEAALVAAECGFTAVRIDSDANRFLERAVDLGEVLALTRNESAVHEKMGIYENVKAGKMAALVLGSEIDLRVFPSAWAHGFALLKADAQGTVRCSLQFFDKWGDAVHNIAELWAVRKPTADGHVTSLEALDAKGEMVIQFFGKRKEGFAERPEWRLLVEGLPRLNTIAAA